MPEFMKLPSLFIRSAGLCWAVKRHPAVAQIMAPRNVLVSANLHSCILWLVMLQQVEQHISVFFIIINIVHASVHLVPCSSSFCTQKHFSIFVIKQSICKDKVIRKEKSLEEKVNDKVKIKQIIPSAITILKREHDILQVVQRLKRKNLKGMNNRLQTHTSHLAQLPVDLLRL